MTINETIAELQRLREFVNPNAEIVGSIKINSDCQAFVRIDVQSIRETNVAKLSPYYAQR